MLRKVIRHGFEFFEAQPAPPLEELPESKPEKPHRRLTKEERAERALRKLEKAEKPKRIAVVTKIPTAEPPPRIPKDIADIQAAIIDAFEVNPGEFFGRSKLRHISVPRIASLALCRELTYHTQETIGYCHNRDHHSTKFAEERHVELREVEPDYQAKVDAIAARFRPGEEPL